MDGSLVRHAQAADWVEGARLRTLPLAIAPVVLGTGIAAYSGGLHIWRAVLALVVALLLQIGVNYSNDYSDGVRGTDEDRVGPARLTGGRLARPSTVKRVAFACYGAAAVCGIWVVALCGQWWLLLAGAIAIVAAWFYTGGKHPYGYAGLGEVSVFLFFGLLATLGTVYVQTGRLGALAWWSAVALGLFACAVLMINNIRDIETDRESGKRTLAVLLGPVGARWAYLAMVLVPLLMLVPMSMLSVRVLWALLTVPLAALAVLRGLAPRNAADHVAALKWTSMSALAFAVLLALGLVL